MSSPGRSVVVLLVVVAVVFAGELVDLLFALVSTAQFGLLLMCFGAAVPIWLRLDRLDHETRRPRPAAAGPPPVVLPRQRVSVEEGAA